MSVDTHTPGPWCARSHRDPLGQTHLQITLEDDVATWRGICTCGRPCGHPTPMTDRELALFPELVRRARRNTLTTVTLAVVDFKEVAR